MKIGNQANLCNQGFSYIGLMIIIAISAIAMAGVGIVWHQDMQREREKQLLFIGDEMARAISSYYNNSPTGAKQYPLSFNDLLLDKRLPVIKRHLRKVYLDPFTNSADWGLIKEQDRISGLYSKSALKPIKKSGFLLRYENFSRAKKYSDWIFLASAISAPPATTSDTTSAVEKKADDKNLLNQSTPNTESNALN